MSGSGGNAMLLHQLSVLKLRHLKRIMGCNFQPPSDFPCPVPPPCLPTILRHPPLQQGYFLSLHLSWHPNVPAFLVSELSCLSHPQWQELNLVSSIPKTLQTAKGLVVRVWYKPPASYCSSERNDRHVFHSTPCASPNMGTLSTSESTSSQLQSDTVISSSTSTTKDDESSHNPDSITHIKNNSSSSSKLPPQIVASNSNKVCILPPEPPDCANKTPAILLCSWAVRLSGLVPIGTNLSQTSTSLAKNTLVFQFMSGSMLYSSADAIISPLPGDDNPSLRQVWHDISLPMSQTKRSYSPNVLNKLHQYERDISSFEEECEQRKVSLRYVGKLSADSRERLLNNQVQALKSRLAVTRAVVQRERHKLEKLQRKVEQAESSNQEKGMQLLTLLQQLGRERQHLRSVCSQSEHQLQQLEKTKSLLAHRRSCLIRELAQVYPIVQISAKDDFSICDIWVPDATLLKDNNLCTPSFQSIHHRNKPPHKPASNSSCNKTTRASTTKNNSRESSPLLGNTSEGDGSSKASPKQAILSSSSPITVPQQLNAARSSSSKKLPESSRSLQVHPPFHPNPNILTQSMEALPHTPESLSAGLGLTAHLLCLVSGLLQLPLRYPITPSGSMATITDLASTQLPEDSRKLPLYTRGTRDKERERLHFSYAVFLLNKNIVELLHYLGRSKLSSTAATLPNLHSALIMLSRKDEPATKSLPDARCQPLLNSNNPGLLTDILTPFMNSNGPPQPNLSANKNAPQSLQGQQPKNLSCSRSPCHTRSNSQSLSQSPQRLVSKSLSPSLSHKSFNMVIQPSGLFSDNNTDKGKRSLQHSASVGDLMNIFLSSPKEDVTPISDQQSLRTNVNDLSLYSSNYGTRTPSSLDSKEACLSSQFTLSLDKGLDHIQSLVDEVRGRGMLQDDINASSGGKFGTVSVDTKLSANTGSLTNLTKNKALVVVSQSIEFENSSVSRFPDSTTLMLRTWQEDSPIQYSYTPRGSTDLLEEVGVEATENFMQPSAPEVANTDKDVNISKPDSLEDRSVRTSNDRNDERLNKSTPVISVPDPQYNAELSKSGKRPINRKEEKTVISKTKARSFWPFSRSNTSEESCKENNSVSEPLLDAEDSDPETQCIPPASKGLNTNSTSKGDSSTTGVVKESDKNSALSKITDDHDWLSSSVEEDTPLLVDGQDSDELFKQSVAAMSREMKVRADLSELNDLSDVTDRTERLASKPFSFKPGK